ncbi:MAG: hypothetical protein JW786_04625 [Desulfobacterales bacterium]|nr:hypothetical protein [Desulfobacterales bacterium]
MKQFLLVLSLILSPIFITVSLPQEPPVALLLPKNIGELERMRLIYGPQAFHEIQQLEVKIIYAEQGVIAYYGEDNQKAIMVWISRAPNITQARQQAIVLVDGIRDTPDLKFHNFNRQNIPGAILYTIMGMHHIHYVIHRNDTVYWISAAPCQADEALKALGF